jgi:hypothetical protein
MDEQLQKDLSSSHSLLNLLFAGYQGGYVALNILNQLSHHLYSTELQAQYDRVLSRTSRWLDELYNGTPLFSVRWTEIETFEARTAFDDLEKLKNEISAIAQDIKSIQKRSPVVETVEDAKYLFASYGRFAYAREFFVRGFFDYGTKFSIPEIAQSASAQLEQLKGTSADIEQILTKFKEGAPNRPFLQQISQRAQSLPIFFGLQSHEMNLTLAFFSQELGYDQVDIGKYEAERWQAVKIPPAAAGYWRAHDIGPEESGSWLLANVMEPQAAYAWRAAGFSPVDSQGWVKESVAPHIAAHWHNAGFEPEEAVSYLKKGITSPRDAKRMISTKKPR